MKNAYEYGGDVARLIEVAVGVLAERRGGRWRVLIARRPRDGVLGGYWELPGGKQEPGETLEQCLVREFEEELGVDVAVTRRLARVEHDYDHGSVRLHAFLCTHLAGEPEARAVSEFRWVFVADLKTYRFPPANDALLAHITDMLADE